jgi:hypothetical protein
MQNFNFSNRKTIIIAAVLIIAGLGYYYRGIFVAASVNGELISRLSVIRELEKKSGKAALEGLVVENLILAEISKSGSAATGEEIDQEIKNVEAQVTASGQSLEAALAAEGSTMEDLRKQISIRKSVEKILANKIAVSDEEVENYIKTNEVTVPKEGADEFKAQIKEQIRSQKFNTEASAWLEALKSNSSIKYFTWYGN